MQEARPDGPAATKPGLTVGRNLGILRRQLKRRRMPAAAAGAYPYGRLVKAGAALTVLLVLVSVIGLDPYAAEWATSLPATSQQFFQFVTQFGRSGWLLIPSGILGIVILLTDWERVQPRLAAAWVEVGGLAGFFFFAVAGAGIVTDVIKWTVGRSRPTAHGADGVLSFRPISFAYEHVSFPSGHATTAAAAFVACVLIFQRRLLVIGAFAAVIALSRVAVRAHYPSDVFAGIFVGAAFTYLYAYALGRSGVAFQRQPDGSLMPKTIAVRLVLRRAGWRAMAGGLRSAWSSRLARTGQPPEPGVKVGDKVERILKPDV